MDRKIRAVFAAHALLLCVFQFPRLQIRVSVLACQYAACSMRESESVFKRVFICVHVYGFVFCVPTSWSLSLYLCSMAFSRFDCVCLCVCLYGDVNSDCFCDCVCTKAWKYPMNIFWRDLLLFACRVLWIPLSLVVFTAVFNISDAFVWAAMMGQYTTAVLDWPTQHLPKPMYTHTHAHSFVLAQSPSHLLHSLTRSHNYSPLS